MSDSLMQVGIIGGGNFGTAIANIIASNGHRTHLWMRDEQQVADTIAHRENRRYLPGHPLADQIHPTNDLAAAVSGSDAVFVSVPSSSFRSVAGQLKDLLDPATALVSLTKGIEGDSFLMMSQILAQVTGSQRTGALSGPNLAEEVASGHYTGTVIASQDDAVCSMVQELLHSDSFRVYANNDVFGVELGGALKNIYAIICGLASALGVGSNTVGMLITRSLAEMSRLAVSLGANPFTFLGLAGVGDLLVTCTSPLSRNYRLGTLIGGGATLEEAMQEMGKLAEGVNTLQVVHAKSQALGVYMPLVEGLHRILITQADVGEVIGQLMTGSQGVDVEFAAPERWQSN